MAGCGGCRGNEIILTEKAIGLLEELGRDAFLPVGERDGKPFYISESGETYSSAVTALVLSGLVDVDYDLPLVGFDYMGYDPCQRRGSMALTKRGQDALEALGVEGVRT